MAFTENEWLTYAKRLQASALTGLAYCKDPYDIERFQEIRGIADEMLAKLFMAPLEQIAVLAPGAKSYVTPMTDVRGAVIENNQILLVREGVSGLWTLPGGFADVGLSPAENVVKEIAEEACISVTAKQLYSVRHKAKGQFNPDAREFYKLYFICERTGQETPVPGPEVSEVAFFPRDRLPELCKDRVVEEDIQRAFSHYRQPGQSALFD
ncbi:NUDIX hydrolase [Cupriavidus pauculus]|uniref:DNA mismatch repair protein MutT n=1 Tax=Cupriavidus pauculus TaxID=82633 RepID=A0A2N5CF55_9BURK|nr:NUDIX hydrolase [Cupriavidus pauculus]PLQ00825.1 DNA mismatch repair protein MutT [Cupriavidus pauculus]